MAIICEICNATESKYRCPSCGLRYCSLSCYKPHKSTHEAETVSNVQILSVEPAKIKIDRPGTTQRTAKQAFTDFEQDAEFQRLLQRYPKLKTQLQGVYGLTLEPGPDEDRSWNRSQLPMIDRNYVTMQRGNRARGRAMRGRGGMRGHRSAPFEAPEGRQRGPWSRDKGDQEALFVLRRVQEESSHEDMADGLEEFVQLVQMRYGDRTQEEQLRELS